MKYIRFQGGAFILFSRGLVHNEVARAGRFNTTGPAISAGFVVTSSGGQLTCSGKSESLGLTAGDNDTAALKEFLTSAPNEDSNQVQESVAIKNKADDRLLAQLSLQNIKLPPKPPSAPR